MDKIVLNNVTGANNYSVVNDNFEKVEKFINDKALSRKTEDGEVNQMNVRLDMNGLPIINLPKATVTGMPVTFEQLENIEQLVDINSQNIQVVQGQLDDAQTAVTQATNLLHQTEGMFDNATGVIATQQAAAVAAVQAQESSSRAALASQGGSLLTQVQNTATTSVSQIQTLTTEISSELNTKYDTVVLKAAQVTADRDFVATEVSKIDGKVDAAAASAATAASAAGTATTKATEAASSATAASGASSSASASASSASSSATTAQGARDSAQSAKVASEAARDRAIQAAIDAEAAAGGGVITFNGRSGAVAPANGDYTKAMVGLGNVDNTSDNDKPISALTQAALNQKLDVSAGGTYAFNISGNAATATKATTADSATTATSATNATNATNANYATSAGSATSATTANSATTAGSAAKWTTPRKILGYTFDGSANVPGYALAARLGEPTGAASSQDMGMVRARSLSSHQGVGWATYDDLVILSGTSSGSKYFIKPSHSGGTQPGAWLPDKTRMEGWGTTYGNYWNTYTSSLAPAFYANAEMGVTHWHFPVGRTGKTVMPNTCIWEHSGILRMRGLRPGMWMVDTGGGGYNTVEMCHVNAVTYFAGYNDGTETPTNQFPLMIEWSANRIRANVEPNTSDRRCKDNIVYMDNVPMLDKVKRLKVAEFDVTPINGTTKFHELGFIAQEFMEEFPVLVEELKVPFSDDTRFGMHYDRVGVIAIKAIQELTAKVEALEAKVAALEAANGK